MFAQAEVRLQFPALREYTYLDLAATAPLAEPVRGAVASYLDYRMSGAYVPELWAGRIEEVRVAVAPASGGVLTPEGVERVADGRTRAVAVASVSYCTGARAPLAELGELCRQRGWFLFVGAVQSLGVLALDVRRTPVDALGAGTTKSLLGLPGLGLLYFRRERAEEAQPPSLADPGAQAPPEALARGVLEYRLAAGARRFEMGHYNLPAVCALGAALDLILGVGVPLIERHVLALSARLTDSLLDLGYSLVSPRDPYVPHRALPGAAGLGPFGGGDQPGARPGEDQAQRKARCYQGFLPQYIARRMTSTACSK